MAGAGGGPLSRAAAGDAGSAGLPAFAGHQGRRALRRLGVLTGSGRELLRGCVVFPLVAAGGANSGLRH